MSLPPCGSFMDTTTTITKDEADQVRRSGRRRMKPLKYWKNERLVVRLDDDHKIKVEEVILANPTPKPK